MEKSIEIAVVSLPNLELLKLLVARDEGRVEILVTPILAESSFTPSIIKFTFDPYQFHFSPYFFFFFIFCFQYLAIIVMSLSLIGFPISSSIVIPVLYAVKYNVENFYLLRFSEQLPLKFCNKSFFNL